MAKEDESYDSFYSYKVETGKTGTGDIFTILKITIDRAPGKGDSPDVYASDIKDYTAWFLQTFIDQAKLGRRFIFFYDIRSGLHDITLVPIKQHMTKVMDTFTRDIVVGSVVLVDKKKSGIVTILEKAMVGRDTPAPRVITCSRKTAMSQIAEWVNTETFLIHEDGGVYERLDEMPDEIDVSKFIYT